MRALLALLPCLAALSLLASERPNLVFILADDATYLDMEVYGGQARTPHLSQLAREGMIFTRCFQSAPMCSPTRHVLYTGLYPVRSGAWPNHAAVYQGTRSIAHYLKEAGYRVALSGKTHIAPRASFPFEYSDEFRSADPSQPDPYPLLEQWILEAGEEGRPFCLFACSSEPHSPYTRGDASAYPPASLVLPPSFVDTPRTREDYSRYLAEITFFDRQCGALLSLLDKHGLRSDTLVMAASEQGSGFPFAKWTCYEMGLASGLVARWPGRVRPGSRSSAMVEYVDVAPTFLEAAGASIPGGLDGRSFLPALLGLSDSHREWTFGIHTTRGIIDGSDAYGIRSCGTARYRYIRNLNSGKAFTNVVTGKDGSKALWASWLEAADAGDPHAREMTSRYQRRPPEELYDVLLDPHCLDNRIGDPALADVRRELSAQLDRWMAEQGDQGRETEAMAHARQARNLGRFGNARP